jgi:hypothetical protein
LYINEIPESFFEEKDPELNLTDEVDVKSITQLQVTGPMQFEESKWKIEEFTKPILLNNRKDANRFIKILKTHPLIQKEYDRIKGLVSEKEPEVFKKFNICYDYVLSNINAKHLYR